MFFVRQGEIHQPWMHCSGESSLLPGSMLLHSLLPMPFNLWGGEMGDNVPAQRPAGAGWPSLCMGMGQDETTRNCTTDFSLHVSIYQGKPLWVPFSDPQPFWWGSFFQGEIHQWMHQHGWLVGGLVGWLVGWLVGRLVGWLFGRVV